MLLGFCVVLLNLLNFVICPYPPTGDEIQAGSVLLPATRRGRYLANIIRRQAVDGTGIKFNKDADRMNAESKKKVDVLSEELLPYIIAEQERRTTLYKRIMTAIQNGEKGVTIAEIRNKPPLIIRKGLLYRCPANRAPKEPDGSGILICEEDIEPTQVMYDSCLSAEDKELYVAENKYFFCNRHRIEGPDLPRNGSSVIGCAPVERTSFNYTTNKCALEDTEDVVVHYRYYPDRTYKYVTELDPDREVCDHWNPCQIGYIYSLPTPDQAVLANELWKDYEDDEYEQIVPQDSQEEYVPEDAKNYTTSPRKVDIPDGYTFSHVVHVNPATGKTEKVPEKYYTAKVDPSEKFVTITLVLKNFGKGSTGKFSAVFNKKGSTRSLGDAIYYVQFLTLSITSCRMQFKVLEMLHGQIAKKNSLTYRCNRCRLLNLMIRGSDGNVYNVDSSKYHVKEFVDRHGKLQHSLDIELDGLRPQDFGDYFVIMQNSDGLEERIKALTVLLIVLPRLTGSFDVGGHFDRTMKYECNDCTFSDILCNGESILAQGRVSIIPVSHMISFNYPRFEDIFSCVYMGFFKQGGRVFRKVIAVIENSSVTIQNYQVLAPPKEGEQFQHIVEYSCNSECTVSQVYVNGILVEASQRRTSGSTAYFVATASEIVIRITEFNDAYEGTYQALFNVGGENVTKNILEISSGDSSPETPPGDGETTPGGGGAKEATSSGAEDATGSEATTVAAAGDATTKAGEALAGEGEGGKAGTEGAAAGSETPAEGAASETPVAEGTPAADAPAEGATEAAAAEETTASARRSRKS